MKSKNFSFSAFFWNEIQKPSHRSTIVVGLRKTDGTGDARVYSIYLFGIALCGAYIGGILSYRIN